MPLEIHLTEGPCVMGLDKDRIGLYVGYCYREAEEGEPLVWRVIEGKKIGTVSSYKLHIGEHGKYLEEAEITRFEYTKKTTMVDFLFQGTIGKLTISNTEDISSDGFVHGTIDEKLNHSYNYFGNGSGNPCELEDLYK